MGSQSKTVAPAIPPSHWEQSVYGDGIGELFERFGTTVRLCSAQATFAQIARGSVDDQDPSLKTPDTARAYRLNALRHGRQNREATVEVVVQILGEARVILGEYNS